MAIELTEAGGDWAERVFVTHAGLFAHILEALKPAGVADARAIRRILSRSGVPPDGRVLDIACGIGRHIVPLAAEGYRTVGCDYSPAYLARARRYARDWGLTRSRVRFLRSDYRTVGRTLRNSRERAFDAAISIFTSMGHFGEAGDLATFRSVRSVVRPGGVFVVEMSNRDWILSHYRATGVMHGTEGIEIHERRRFDPKSSTSLDEWTYYSGSKGRRRRLRTEHVAIRLYSPDELRKLLERSGWIDVRTYGGLTSRAPASARAPRMVLLARRG